MLMEKHIPVYTVHDNFITPAIYAHIIPEFYAKAFYEIVSPLYTVNRLLYDNLLRYSDNSRSLMNTNGNTAIDKESWHKDQPIPI